MRKKLLAGVAAAALTGAFSSDGAAQQPPLMNWSGFYTGVHAGWGQARFSGTWIDTSVTGSFPWRTKPSGFLGGVHTGQNWQTNTFVYGWEADVSATGGWKKTVFIANPNHSGNVLTKVSLLASLRTRLGVNLDPNTLAYLTGGLGYIQAKATASDTANNQGTAKFNTFGGVVGAGVEWKQAQNFSWRLEGLWYIFNKSKTIFVVTDQNVAVKLKDAIVVRGGATWHY